jgi:hypothetical protein
MVTLTTYPEVNRAGETWAASQPQRNGYHEP